MGDSGQEGARQLNLLGGTEPNKPLAAHAHPRPVLILGLLDRITLRGGLIGVERLPALAPMLGLDLDSVGLEFSSCGRLGGDFGCHVDLGWRLRARLVKWKLVFEQGECRGGEACLQAQKQRIGLQ